MTSTRALPPLLAVLGIAFLAGCSTAAPGAPGATPARSASPSPATSPTTTVPPAPETDEAAQPVVGTVLRFTGDGTTVDVTLDEDNPTSRDLLARLPTTIRFEELSGREKIGYPDPALTTAGSPGSDPEDGDLIYYAPWGNLGFYYDATGIEYSDDTIHLGTYRATAEQLAAFDDVEVTVEVAG